MNKLMMLLFLLISFISSSQRDSVSSTFYSGITIEYGQKFFHDDFGKNLKSINNIESNTLPIEMISFNFMGYIVVNGAFNFPGCIKFSYLLPKDILVNNVKQKLRGFNFNYPVYGHKLIDKKHFGLFLSEGIQIGRLKLVNEDKEIKKNMTIAPFVGLVTKINVSKLCFSFIAQYDYDISSKMWKKQWVRPNQNTYITGLRQSGLTISTGIGYAF